MKSVIKQFLNTCEEDLGVKLFVRRNAPQSREDIHIFYK